MMQWRAFAVAGVVLALAAPAAARPVVRQGVPVDALTPPGLERVRVRAPSVDGQPVRLTYAAAGTGRAQVLIDVVVGASAAQARAALDHWRHQLTREPGVVEGLGDVAYGTDALVAFARDNVMIAVRRVAGEGDVLELAAQAHAAVVAAPRGSPAAVRRDVGAPRALARGEIVELAQPADALAAELRVDGPASARRTSRGWRLSRTGEGAVRVRLVTVDGMLRVGR